MTDRDRERCAEIADAYADGYANAEQGEASKVYRARAGRKIAQLIRALDLPLTSAREVTDAEIEAGARALDPSAWIASTEPTLQKRLAGRQDRARRQARACFAVLSPAPSPQSRGETISGLGKFFADIFHAACEGNDLSGGQIQDLGVATGLLVVATYDPVVHGDNYDCDPGDDIFVYSDELKTLRQSLSARREG